MKRLKLITAAVLASLVALGLSIVLIDLTCGPSCVSPFTAYAQKQALGTSADITMTGSAVQFSTTGAARWIQIIAPAGNAQTVRVGDSNVGTSRGAAVAAGGGFMLPPIPVATGGTVTDVLYQFSTIYFFGTSSDKVTVTWGN